MRSWFKDTASKRLATELLGAERKQAGHERRADHNAAKVVLGGRRAAREQERAELMDGQIERPASSGRGPEPEDARVLPRAPRQVRARRRAQSG
jgi:hypothetical protein